MLSARYWSSPLAIAHRGSRELWPENTMEAFQGAVDLGIRAVETDLHVTSDGVLVCFHDDTLDRTTNGSGPVSDFTFAELADLDAGHRHRRNDHHPFRGAGYRIPSFEELATTFPDLALVVDLKVDGLIEPLAAMAEKHSLYDRLIVGAFSDERLGRFVAATEGRIPVSAGPTLSRAWLLSSRLGRPGGGVASALQIPVRTRGVRVVDKRLVEVAHAHRVHVHVWTVNDPDEMHQLLDLGVDGIVSDRPDGLKAVLTERGEWGG